MGGDIGDAPTDDPFQRRPRKRVSLAKPLGNNRAKCRERSGFTGESPMAKIIKVIEVLSESPNSWEEAAQNAITEAAKTLRNIRSVYVSEFTVAVENNKATAYRVNAKVSFEMERS
jgi:dodecin